MAGEQSAGRFGQFIQRPGPGMEINAAALQQSAAGVVKAADAQARQAALDLPVQVGQRAVFEPFRQARARTCEALAKQRP